MSVNVVNNNYPGQNSAQESYSGRIIGSAAGAAVGASAGIASGYLWGGKTPTLEEVFAQDADTFKASAEKMEKKNEEAAKKVADARDNYTNSQGLEKAKEAEKKAQEAFDDAAKKIENYEGKDALEKAVNDANVDVEIKAEAEEATSKKKISEFKKDELTTEELKEKRQKYDEAVKAQNDAQAKALRDAAAKDENAKKVVNELDNAKKKVEEETKKAMDSALNDDVKGAFKKVRRSLTEGKGKSMALWGSIAGIAALAAGYFIGKSIDANKNN